MKKFYCLTTYYGNVSPCCTHTLHVFPCKKDRDEFIAGFICHDGSVNTVAYEIPAVVARKAYTTLVDGMRMSKRNIVNNLHVEPDCL